jgi:transposase
VSKAIEARYDEMYLFPPAVEDWVGVNHPSRFIREVVEALDLEQAGFAGEETESAGELGRPHYGNRLLLGAWIYGYMNQIRSSRKLERACREHVSLIWLLGRQEPDHNTLWRFWKRNRRAIRRVYRQVLAIAQEAGLIGLVLHALDGTKIQSAGSTSRGWYRKRLEKLLKRLDERIDQMEREVEAAETGEVGEYELPQGLEDRRVLRATVRQALAKLESLGRNQLTESDPEARVMPCSGRKVFGYNAQAVVDADSGMIVAEAVVDDANDSGQLLPMLEQAEVNLGQSAEDTVADKGYRNERSLHEAASEGHSVLVNLYETEGEEAGPYHISRFRYDAERGVCICPLGKELAHEGTKKSRHYPDRWETSYRCRHGGQCPAARQCSRDPAGRKVTFGPYQVAIAKQRERHREPEAQRKLRRRKAIVERVFAEIKEGGQFRRWTFRGHTQVQTQWSMICIAFNLKRLLTHWQDGKLQLVR